MVYTYLLAGENLNLSEYELKGFLKSQKISESPVREGRLAETESEPNQLKRLARTHEVGRKLEELDRENLNELDLDFRPENSFEVRTENLSSSEIQKEGIEEVIGEKLSEGGNEVDLDNPDQTIKVYVMEETCIISIIVEDINRGLYERRNNEERPFSSPISLDPVLARTIVNLSGKKPGETVLDPFCGTGGILLEAGLCGLGVKGFDIQDDMVEGCRENLEEYGIISHKIRHRNITDLEVSKEDCEAIITDLPYGKSSKKTEDAIDSFIELINDFEGTAVFVWNEETLRDYRADFSVYVHGSLNRYIYLVD